MLDNIKDVKNEIFINYDDLFNKNKKRLFYILEKKFNNELNKEKYLFFEKKLFFYNKKYKKKFKDKIKKEKLFSLLIEIYEFFLLPNNKDLKKLKKK